MRKKIYFHCGFHKTGSTSLQTYLLDNYEALRPYAYVLNRETERHSLDVRTQSLRRYIRDHARNIPNENIYYRIVRPLLSDIYETNATIALVSDEDLIGPMPGRDKTGNIYPLLSKYLAAILQIFEPHDVRFIFYTRDMSEWIKSVHAQCVKKGHTHLDLPEFAQKLEEWPSLEGMLHARLPDRIRKRMHVIRFEEELSPGTKHPKCFLDAIGFKNIHELKPLRRENTSLDKYSLSEKLKLNKALYRLKKLHGADDLINAEKIVDELRKNLSRTEGARTLMASIKYKLGKPGEAYEITRGK